MLSIVHESWVMLEGEESVAGVEGNMQMWEVMWIIF